MAKIHPVVMSLLKVRDEAMRAGLYVTGRHIDSAIQVVGHEIAGEPEMSRTTIVERSEAVRRIAANRMARKPCDMNPGGYIGEAMLGHCKPRRKNKPTPRASQGHGKGGGKRSKKGER